MVPLFFNLSLKPPVSNPAREEMASCPAVSERSRQASVALPALSRSSLFYSLGFHSAQDAAAPASCPGTFSAFSLRLLNPTRGESFPMRSEIWRRGDRKQASQGRGGRLWSPRPCALELGRGGSRRDLSSPLPHVARLPALLCLLLRPQNTQTRPREAAAPVRGPSQFPSPSTPEPCWKRHSRPSRQLRRPPRLCRRSLQAWSGRRLAQDRTKPPGGAPRAVRRRQRRASCLGGGGASLAALT